MKEIIPPYTLTTEILRKCQLISHILGVLQGARISLVPLKLRKENKIRTIQSTLAIEGNSLSIEQITGLLEGKRIVGPKKDILEVNNAIKVYSNLDIWDPLSRESFKKAHKILMKNLIPNNGEWRTRGIGIFKGKEIAHVAPPASRVEDLMNKLFSFLKKNKDIPWLVKGSVFHYELEFIHPFSDGNGRMGRLWQQLLFIREDPIFAHISIEALIRKSQKKYYDCLAECDRLGNSTKFIEFSLEQTFSALKEYSELPVSKNMDVEMRLQYAKEKLQGEWFARKTYMELHKDISTATASRDLEKGKFLKILDAKGSKTLTKYRFLML